MQNPPSVSFFAYEHFYQAFMFHIFTLITMKRSLVST